MLEHDQAQQPSNLIGLESQLVESHRPLTSSICSEHAAGREKPQTEDQDSAEMAE